MDQNASPGCTTAVIRSARASTESFVPGAAWAVRTLAKQTGTPPSMGLIEELVTWPMGLASSPAAKTRAPPSAWGTSGLVES